MKELHLNCDSPCFSCPNNNRMLKVSSFNERNLPGAYFCSHCQTYSLCRLGVAYQRNRNNGDLIPICPKCKRSLSKIRLIYEIAEEKNAIIGKNKLLFIRKPNGRKFEILKVLKGSFFKDTSELLLFAVFLLEIGIYNIISYDEITQEYKKLFYDLLHPDNIKVVAIPPAVISNHMLT